MFSEETLGFSVPTARKKGFSAQHVGITSVEPEKLRFSLGGIVLGERNSGAQKTHIWVLVPNAP